MSEIKNKEQEDPTLLVSPSINAIYSYSEQYIKTRLEMYYKLETRIFGLLAFSGVALKVVADLPNFKGSEEINFAIVSLILKVLTLGLITVSIGTLILSIQFKLDGKATSIEGIARAINFFAKEEWYFKTAVFNQWHELDKSIDSATKKRGKSINNALNYLVIAGILYTMNIMLIAIKTYASYLFTK